ncbi:MAG: hypothetical protein KDD50_06175 [Bdellovibrionales bacterium]|nr:hypothetical protein [Bdellovibrionales bacterium]
MKFIAQNKQFFYLSLLFSIVVSVNAKAENDITIFDVRKTLVMDESEPSYKDYYLNGGSEIGLKPGMVVTVKRRRALYDGFQNKSLEELMVVVGKLKLIHVQKGVSVARLYSLFSRKNTPVLDYEYIMLGDQVDLNSVYMDRGKESKSAEVAPSPTVEPRVVPEPEKPQPEVARLKPETVEAAVGSAEMSSSVSVSAPN